MIENGRTPVTPRRFLRTFGSLWFAAVLLILLLVSMASATAYESAHGAAQALAVFYLSWWFEGLFGLLALNILASMLVRWPFSRKLAGFVVTHASILVILAGALVTQRYAIDGMLRIGEGQSETHLTDQSQQTLIVVNTRTQNLANLALPRGVFGGFQAAERIDLAPLSYEGLQIAVEKYLPDSQRVQHVTEEGDAQLPPAVEVTLGIMGKSESGWILAGRSAELANTEVAYRPVTDATLLGQLIAPPSEKQTTSAGTVKVVYKDKPYEFPLENVLEKGTLLGDTGYTLRVLHYWPHASVGADRRMTNDPARPANPAIEAEVSGHDVEETRIAFANFPGFRHGSDKIEGLDVTFVSSGAEQTSPLAPIEIIEGPAGELYGRISWAGLPSTARPLELGKSMDTPWPGGELTVKRRYAHAREEWLMNPVNPPGENRAEAVQLRLTAGGKTQTLWLQKDHSEHIRDGNTTYEIGYTDRLIPLGFAVALRQFRLGTYPGGRSPRSFESLVDFSDPDTGRVRGAVVSMNSPASHGGFTFLQSSYEQHDNGNVTVLRVTSDPGKPIAFLGYGLLFVGLIILIVTRLTGPQRKLNAVATN
jgi:hypothetical protein